LHAVNDRWFTDAHQRNIAAHAGDRELLLTTRHVIDVQHARRKRELDLEEMALRDALEHWVMKPAPEGGSRSERPPPALWNKLSYAQQKSVDAALVHTRGAWMRGGQSRPPTPLLA
jgi:hypothetical protein